MEHDKKIDLIKWVAEEMSGDPLSAVDAESMLKEWEEDEVSDYIDTREGWREVLYQEIPAGQPHLITIESDLAHQPELRRYWVRDTPVPTLPTVPFSMFRAHYADGEHIVGFVLPDGIVPFTHVTATGCPLDEAAAGHGQMVRIEVLAEPRAITAKAVLGRVQEEIGNSAWLLSLRREFRVDTAPDAV